ncbi:EAL domain-containing protein [Alteromonas sp. ASW11-19]|uniref:EAL domain-containing protein n=1 Tax=Alteromonas salexigens TaxID=2982530 RepID=A0ABT2VSG6_9ALTE|nr:EAL domain-containing protein [Alteromonas salexigens]MCU7555176.1 EAL domain-containing protein [Alteromonas salexigens]
MRTTLFFSFIVVLFASSSLGSVSGYAAEITDYQFSEVSQRGGLSDGLVFDIAEDPKGYIWIATMNGLNRYSGYDMVQYHPSDTDSNSLPSGLIKSLHVDNGGNLWVGTYSGLARYIPETDNFKVFNESNSALRSGFIFAISNTHDGDVLIADSNNTIYRVDVATNAIQVLNNNIRVAEGTRTLLDEPNRTWIGSIDHVGYLYSKTDKTLYPLDKVNPWGISLESSAMYDIAVINGEYWLGTDQGITVLGANGATIARFDKTSLGLSDTVKIYAIKEYNDKVWLGTDSGLFVLTTTTGEQGPVIAELDHIGPDLADITGLTERTISTLVPDSAGGLWLGSLNGAFRYHPEQRNQKLISNIGDFQNTAKNATVWGLDKDTEGNIWFVTQEQGLGSYNKQTGDIQYYLTSLADSGVSFWDVIIDEYGVFWIASSNGLLAYEFHDNTIKRLATFYKDELFDRLYFGNKRLWLVRDDNQLASVRTNLLKDYLATGGDDPFFKIYNLSQTKGLESGEYLIPIFLDGNNRLWLTSANGIHLLSLATGQIVKSLNARDGFMSRAIGVYETSSNYWVTTRSDGVLKLDKRTLQILHKQQRNEGGFIFSTIGVDNFIWYADSQGVHTVDLNTLNVVDTISNVQLNFNPLNEDAVLKANDSELIFGGELGFNSIIIDRQLNGNDAQAEPTRPPQLLDFKVFGRNRDNSGSPDTSSITVDKETQQAADAITNITYKNNLSLAYEESKFSVTFGLINPLSPESVQYRYRLSGYDDEWTNAENNRTAQFNNVSFGQHVFEVQARESGKQWSDSRQLAIKVARPPWLHSVALGFYALILTVVLVFIIRQYQIRKANQQAIYESEERLKLTLWSSGDELWDWDVYRGQVYRANTWGTLDFPQDDIRTHSSYDANIHPNDMVRVKEALQAHLDGKSEFFELAYRARTFKNKWIWILDRGKVVQRDHNNQPVRMTGTLKNIHHLKEAEEQLNLFKRSIENISEGVFITDTQFRFISINNAYCKYTGETRDQALASYLYFHQYPEAFTEEIKKTLRSKGNWSGEVESTRINGERYEMELNIDAVHDEDGKISHFVGVFSDITSRKSTEKELLKLANTDPLTELPNRSFFQASHRNLVRKAVPHTLICLDMDNFKKINDSLGHQTGDILIKQIAKRLQRITGKDATCYRLGGDEFSVLMEDHTDIHTVTHYAQSVLDNLSRPFIINKQEFVLGASVGIAFYPDDGTTPQEMLKNADTAMYFAKNNGGNSYQFFSGEMNQNAVRQLQIENLIRQGIKDDLFTVYYQPKVDIASGRLVSMEALVRFEHPHKGIVSPGQFIPLAEQTGQIIEIGEQVLRKSLADTKRWVNEGLFSGRVAVNISVKQFELPDLDDRIDKILNDVGLSPLHLECEITEGTLMENPEAGLRMMERLRERGIHLALDDFGTGYSSLAYLKRFPLNTLKIDKAFIDDIAKSSVDRHMAAAIISIAHNLGLKVVAEGVEEESQLSILRRYDCEMLQGYLYSKPLNAERFEKLLRENQKLHHLISHSNA